MFLDTCTRLIHDIHLYSNKFYQCIVQVDRYWYQFFCTGMTSSPILLQVFWLCWPCSHSLLCFTTFLNQLCLLWLSFLWYKWWMWWLWRSSGKLTVSLQGSKEFCRVTYFKRQAGFTLKGLSSLCMIQLWGKILKYLMFHFYHYSIKILSPIWICFS